jgi:uncharacterized protein YndB with AHSA1/START domain
MKVEQTIEIEAPPERVWSFMTESEKILEWYIPLQKLEYTSEQRSGVGAPFYFEESAPGGSLKLHCVVTEWVENEAFAFRMTSGNLLKSYEERWTVEATPSGSSFTFSEKGEFPYAIIGKLIAPIAQRMSGATVEKMLAKLKSMVEQ